MQGSISAAPSLPPNSSSLSKSRLKAGLSDITSPEEVNAIIKAEDGAVVVFINRAYEVMLVA